MIGKANRLAGIGPILALAAAVLLVYWPVTGYDFIALDDHLYVLGNPHVQEGLTAEGIVWALTTLYTTNWHPLTWFSLMADHQLYGLDPGGYHLSSLLLHVLNTSLLFWLLRRMTGQTGRSFWVAVLFAVHPLNIESVVWIAERKNLLSTLFWMLTLMAYLRYTRRPLWGRYLVVLFLFLLGLMAKPMLVSLPLAMLLVDYWPLRRLSGEVGRPGSILGRPFLEKLPFLALSLLSALLTFYAAHSGGAVKSLHAFSAGGRLLHASVSYLQYLYKMFWPAELAIYYPYPPVEPLWQGAGAAALLGAVTAIVLLSGRRHRYLPVGWFWYLLTLLPVIGIVQVGFQSMANRYAYLPLVGIFIMLVWGLSELTEVMGRRPVVCTAAAAVVLVLALSTRMQLPNWRDSEAAFSHALRVTQNNHIAQIGLGNVWFAKGELQKAEACYRDSLRIKPDYPEAHNNLGLVFAEKGNRAEAQRQYREAIRDDPGYAEGYYNLGLALLGEGRREEAAICLLTAMELEPGRAGECREFLRRCQGRADAGRGRAGLDAGDRDGDER